MNRTEQAKKNCICDAIALIVMSWLLSVQAWFVNFFAVSNHHLPTLQKTIFSKNEEFFLDTAFNITSEVEVWKWKCSCQWPSTCASNVRFRQIRNVSVGNISSKKTFLPFFLRIILIMTQVSISRTVYWEKKITDTWRDSNPRPLDYVLHRCASNAAL